MGANSILGLIFQISADPSKAQEALSQFEKSTGTSLNRVVNHTEVMNKSLLGSHESARLLTEELGVHLPRAVTGAVGEMLPEFESLGTVLLAAFAVKELPEVVSKIHDLADEMRGFGQEEKALFAEVVKDSDDAYTHAKKLSDAIRFDAELNTNIAAAQRLQDAMLKADDEGARFQQVMGDLITGNVVGAATEIGQMLEIHDLGNKLTEDQRKQLVMLQTLTDLEKEKHKEETDTAKAQQRGVDAYNAAISRGLTFERQWYAQKLEMIELIHENNDAMAAEAAQEQRLKEIRTTLMVMGEMELPLQRQSTQGLHILGTATADLTEKTKHLNFARREELLLMQALGVAGEHEAKATKKDLVEAAQSASASLADLIGGQRAAAAVNAVFDAAKGAEQVAMALDPFDPNHAMHWISAAQFFVASAEFAKIAGTSTRHHGGGSVGHGSYNGGGGGRSDSSYRDQPPPRALAAGAASGRFSQGQGVVIIHGDQDFHEFIAGAVNEAVARGIGVTATYSQRGSPVGN